MSFVFCYVKSVPEGADPKGVSSMTCLVMVDFSDRLQPCNTCQDEKSVSAYCARVADVLSVDGSYSSDTLM